MPWLLEALSMFDWVTPLKETYHDFDNFATGIHGGRNISVNKGELKQAKKVIERAGYRVISTSMAAFDSEGIITVECYGGVDGQESVRQAIDALQSKGIDTWGY